LRYYLGVDAGTTEIKSVLFDEKGRVVCSSRKRVRKIYPKPQWVEKDPIEALNALILSVRETLEKARVKKVEAMGLANEGESVVIWDAQSGKPIYNAITWEDRRTAKLCKQLKHLEKEIKNKTGLKLESYFSATKARWIVENAKRSTKLMFGTMDSWFLWNLTGFHVTDVSTASRTMLFDINSLKWDEELISLFGLHQLEFPEVKQNSEFVAHTKSEIFGFPIAISALCVDQQASLYGHGCTKQGELKITYGTGAFALANIGDAPKYSQSLLTTVAWKIDGKTSYAFDGGVYSAGSAINWLIELGVAKSEKEVEELSRSVHSSEALFVIPAFSGLACPYWVDDLKASIHGITLSHTRAHFARATLESIAYLVSEIVEAMQKELGSIAKIRVDGGMSKNRFLVQLQSDVLQKELYVCTFKDVTAFGVASLAKRAIEGNGFSQKKYVKYSPSSNYERQKTDWKEVLTRTLYSGGISL
jgi:Glycerol kinase